MTTAGTRPTHSYRERLSPSLWVLVSAAVCGPMAALVFAPLDPTLALIAGVVVGVGIVALFIALAPIVEVREGQLFVGRAHIDVDLLGRPVGLVGEDARLARGQQLDHHAWHLLRPGIDGAVRVPIEDADDPAPYWLVSTRTPDRLSAAIRAAQSRD